MKKYLLIISALLFSTQAQATVWELIDSVKQNNLPEVIKLLDNGENVNAVTEQGNTALHYAVALDNPEITEVLLSRGADIQIANEKGWTPLLIAQKKNVPNVIPVLQKALQNMQDPQYQTESATIENTVISAEDIAVYRQLLERAKQDIIESNSKLDVLTTQNELLADEIVRLKTELEIANDKIAAQANRVETSAEDVSATKTVEEKKAVAEEKKNAEPAKAPIKKVQPQKTPAKTVDKKPVYQPRYSTLVPQIYAGNEEVVYCLNYLGQSENANMVKAAGHYAAAVGINEARYDQIVNMSNDFYNLKDAAMRQKRADECSKIITPADAARQNQIIRSFNYALGH